MTPVELPYVPILLNETFITALWDTGAEKSFISEEVYRNYFHTDLVKDERQSRDSTRSPVQSFWVESNYKLESGNFRNPGNSIYLITCRLFSDQPGLTHVVYHEIDTGDKGPVVSRPYKYDRVKQGIIDYHIDKMLRDGTICPINSPYASPVVLTRKEQ
ncbi:hypothetical protein TNCV_789341 [Trichonephila clavipes]|nr:hypothetical protein TNCV_789341 [Trichonephila clavipes]